MIIHAPLRRLAAGVLLASGPAFAQAPSPTPTPTLAPRAEPTTPGKTLSDKLNQSNGVIHPKEVDQAIEKPAPKTGDANVLPPPATPGPSPTPTAK